MLRKCLTTFLGIALLSASALAVETGFDTGNVFQWQDFEGRVFVSCSDSSAGHPSYFCEDSVLSPADYARFVTAPGIDADRVELTATWANGKKVTKRDAFDSASGRSKGRFNLSIETLTQRRLLGNGVNLVEYKLTKNGEVVSQGTFEAVLNPSGPAKVCSSGTIFENNGSACRDAYAMCGRYFREAARNCR